MYDFESSMYDQERNDELADHLEEFVDTITSLFILEGTKVSEVKKAKKVLKNAIEDLRNGKPEKVFNIERYEEYMMKKKSGYYE